MKKKIYLLFIMLVLCFTAVNSNAALKADNPVSFASMTAAQKSFRLKTINARIIAIKDTDKSNMSKADRKQLKLELKSLRHESNAISGGGVALSIGGGVVILVLVGLLSGL